MLSLILSFFFTDTATTEIYTSVHTLSLHDALPISKSPSVAGSGVAVGVRVGVWVLRSEEHTSELQSRTLISYAVFCLKKKKALCASEAILGCSDACVAQTAHTHKPSPISVAWGYSYAKAAPVLLFFFNDTATTEIYTSVHTLSLHDALPISPPDAPTVAPAQSETRRTSG